MTDDTPRDFLAALFRRAVRAADPRDTIAAHLPDPPRGRTVVIGAGKAASRMAAALESVWPAPLDGVVIDRYGPITPTKKIKVLQASHPVPDVAGLAGAKALLAAVGGLTADDLVIALISGGGSALLPMPGGSLTLANEIAVNEALLRSGAPIAAMNVVRKHVSGIKGGRLAQAAAPARVVSLLVSDVAGDNPALVASGPTVPSATTPADALAIIDDYRMKLPEAVIAHLRSPAAIAPMPDDPAFAQNRAVVVASARTSLYAAADFARSRGVTPVVLSDAIEGGSQSVGSMHAAIAREVARFDQPFSKPVVLLSGGETTVALGDGPVGRGGPNTEFLLSVARGIAGLSGVHALAADTDGIDGSEDNAGAFADGQSFARMRMAGIDPQKALHTHDAWTAFAAIDDLLVTGPTGTNVNDFRAILIR
ncbi:MAG TPA: glycerate kinase [Pelagibacterium sp.]|uniref:glycerate kinase type-2 family protein n=1 Tax=Pelagibacterium sp. TaxID=1967288 RepID=UPI002BCC1529|nr:glycerate kinase [Pelagibacterium sp.]HWJ89414.1 glycerate kinase [Pelagibacterium sp.]